MDEQGKLDGVDAIVLGLIVVGLYLWFRLVQKAAEVAVRPAIRLVRPTVRSVIERAEQITREAVDTAGKDSS